MKTTSQRIRDRAKRITQAQLNNMLMTDLESLKGSFITEVARVSDYEEAIANAINVSLQHNPTYVAGDLDRQPFRIAFSDQLRNQLLRYRAPVGDEEHCAAIERVSDALSKDYGGILIGGRLRIGTTQKALNLLLKTMWCLEQDWPAPPHCPVDRIILEEAGIYGNWTQLDSIGTYRHWISGIRYCAKGQGFESVAEWELCAWQGEK